MRDSETFWQISLLWVPSAHQQFTVSVVCTLFLHALPPFGNDIANTCWVIKSRPIGNLISFSNKQSGNLSSISKLTFFRMTLFPTSKSNLEKVDPSKLDKVGKYIPLFIEIWQFFVQKATPRHVFRTFMDLAITIVYFLRFCRFHFWKLAYLTKNWAKPKISCPAVTLLNSGST